MTEDEVGLLLPGEPPCDAGPWDAATLDTLREWDPQWADACDRVTTDPWHSRVLSRKFVELVSAGLALACTNLDAGAARRHMRAALTAGATREELLLVVKCATMLSIHSCSVAAPILLQEAQTAEVDPASRTHDQATPACDAMRAAEQWNDTWNPFFDLDPAWTDKFMATAVVIYQSEALSAKEIELLSIALDASFTHLYAPGIRRHIRGALRAGATTQEIMDVLKLCVAQGVQAANLGVAILTEELERDLRPKD